MCDLTVLRKNVEKLVHQKLDACEAFTSVDISHPLIADDPDIRHHEVRACLNQILTQELLDEAEFTASMITVYPNGPGSAGCAARLWHPVSYDASEYETVNQILVRKPALSAKPSIPDTKGNMVFSVPLDNSTPSKSPGTCHIQQVENTLNIPKAVVSKAGFKPYDHISVKLSLSDKKACIVPALTGTQRVDREGRIRLHGENARFFTKNVVATATVIDNQPIIQLVSV